MSPVDQFGRGLQELRISLTDRCNFRCSYCMPKVAFEGKAFLPKKAYLTHEELQRLVGLFERWSLRKIRLTGGEPLMRRDLEDIIASLSGLSEELSLTTNGSYLAARAMSLKQAGLHRLNISLDALDARLFSMMNDMGYSLKKVLDGVDAALAAGFSRVKVNTVVIRGVNDDQIIPIIRWAHDLGLIPRFIEFMDVGGSHHWGPHHVVPSSEIQKNLSEIFTLASLSPNYSGEVARRFRVEETGGEVGFISSISQPFCGSCERGRLSADGTFYKCLFAGNGLALGTMMRSGATDQEILEALSADWQGRTDRYSELRCQPETSRSEGGETKVNPWQNPQPRVDMHHIGG